MVTRFWTRDWQKYLHPFKIKIDFSYHPFIKYDIFEVNVNLPPRVTHIGIIAQYCEHHNMSYISQSKNNITRDHTFLARNMTNVCILIIVRKEPTTVQQVLESMSSQQLTLKWNKVHVITSLRDKDIVRTNLQENICIFNKIRHIQEIEKNQLVLL